MADIKMFTVPEYFQEVSGVLSRIPQEPIEKLISMLRQAREENRIIFCCGNGGSAGNASHFVNDVVKSTVVEGRPRYRLISLTDNVPTLTAYANDVGYEVVFSEPLQSLGREGDILLTISGSGNSPNVLMAVEAAKRMGIKTIGLSGFQGGKLAPLCDVSVVVPSDSMQIIEDAHLILLHAVFVQLYR
jgi:D-sedoheptulose 7-phosphate isomerase